MRVGNEALGQALQAVERAPRDPSSWAALGRVLLQAGQAAQAVEALQQAAALDDRAARWSDVGVALRKAGRPDAARVALDTAVARDPAHRGARLNRAAFSTWAGRPFDALADLDAALARHPGDSALLGARATALLRCGRPDAALATIDQALTVAPDDPRHLWNQALALLAAGRLQEGFARYGARRGRVAGTGARRRPGIPLWTGGPLAGRTILLGAEQGFGDTLQFIRFGAALAARGATVVAEVHKRLVALLSGTPGLHAVVPKDGPVPDVDAQVALMDVPGLLGMGEADLDLGTYLRADPARVARLAPRTAGPGLAIGIGWQGNPAFELDHLRSPPLAAFAPLAAASGVRFFCLQQMHGRDQLATAPLALDDVAPELDQGPDGFVDTAAVLANLDLVITSDTALAHLAGGLGRPTWVVLPHAADWRWMVDRSDCPWYPSMRLFRQPAPGAWGPVFAAVGAALARVSAGEEQP